MSAQARRPDERRLAIFYGQGTRKLHVVPREDYGTSLCGRVLRGPWDTTSGLPAFLHHPDVISSDRWRTRLTARYCTRCVRLAQEASE